MLREITFASAPDYLRKWGDRKSTAWATSTTRNLAELLEHQEYRTLRDALAELGRGAKHLETLVVHETDGERSLEDTEIPALIDVLNREIES